MTTRITGWHVEGFGVLHDYQVDDIPTGLTVFTGPNEAGKSTLLAFIRTMLFGFQTMGAAGRQYPPLRGGRHGGRLSLQDADGETYTIDRHAGRRTPVVTSGSGNALPDDLDRLLGGCDRQLFQSVFAFDLADLQELEGLNHAEVQDRLALVGIAGSGESPSVAIARLAQRRARASLVDGGINDLSRRLEDTDHALEAAYHQVEHARSVRAEALLSSRLLTERGLELAALQARQQRTRSLLQAWPDWMAKTEAEDELAQLVSDDAIVAVADEVEAVAEDLTPYQRACQELPDLERARNVAARAFDARLRDLGPDWDRRRLSSTGTTGESLTGAQGFAAELTQANAALVNATRDVIAAREEVTTASREAAALAAERATLTAIAGDRDIAECQAAVRRLRARRSDLTNAEVQSQVAEANLEGLDELQTQAERKTGAMPPRWLGGIALAIFAAAIVGAVILVASGDLLPAAVVAGAAGGGLILGLVHRSQTDRAERERLRRQQDISTRITNARATLDRQRAGLAALRADIAANAATLGLNPWPSSGEIDQAERHLTEAAEASRQLELLQSQIDQTAHRLEEVSRVALEAEVARDQAAAARDAVVTNWERWRSRSGLPDSLQPAGAVEFLALIEDGRHQARILGEHDAAVTRAMEVIQRVDSRLDAIGRALGLEDDQASSPVANFVASLQKRLNQDRDTRQRIAALDAASRQATERVRAVLGEDEERWYALATGTPGDWQADLATTERQIDELEDERLALARASGEAEMERQVIEASADIPTLHLRRNMLRAELETALHEQRVSALAEYLIRETVRRIERERQPDVLRRASALFQRITADRYQRVFRPVDGKGLLIEDDAGSTRAPEALSRGTLEQLYVALRLGLAESFTDKVGALPLIMDDVLVNFDPERARGVARALFDVASGRQVLLFTSQPATVDMLSSLGSHYGHFAMERHGTGGDWVKRP